jgi:hypothetical protein
MVNLSDNVIDNLDAVDRQGHQQAGVASRRRQVPLQVKWKLQTEERTTAMKPTVPVVVANQKKPGLHRTRGQPKSRNRQ